MTQWTREKPILGGSSGCKHCGIQHDILPMTSIIGVGFGDACLTKNDKTIYSEPQGDDVKYSDIMTAQQAEELASKDPDNDWRIHLVAPLSERHYQRQG